MKARDILDEILQILYTVKENRDKLQKILHFLKDEVYKEPEEPTEIEIPEKYKKIVSEIADNINAGSICFLNPYTLEMESIPNFMFYDKWSRTPECYNEPLKKIDTQWKRFIRIEPLKPHESFKIMEKFANNLKDNALRNGLINALNRK